MSSRLDSMTIKFVDVYLCTLLEHLNFTNAGVVKNVRTPRALQYQKQNIGI